MSSNDIELPRVPFRESLSRVIQLKGGDRRLVILVVALACFLGLATLATYGIWVAVGVTALTAGLLLAGVYKLGKYDPQIVDIAIRHVSYRSSYPARGRFTAPARQHKDW